MFSRILATSAVALRLEIRAGLGRVTLRHIVAKRAEDVVARHKIRLAVHLHEHAEPSIRRDVLGDGAVLGVARGLHIGGRLALLAQNAHGVVEVALGFHERLFAVHHARAGHFPELAHVSSSKFSHNSISFKFSVQSSDLLVGRTLPRCRKF